MRALLLALLLAVLASQSGVSIGIAENAARADARGAEGAKYQYNLIRMYDDAGMNIWDPGFFTGSIGNIVSRS